MDGLFADVADVELDAEFAAAWVSRVEQLADYHGLLVRPGGVVSEGEKKTWKFAYPKRWWML